MRKSYWLPGLLFFTLNVVAQQSPIGNDLWPTDWLINKVTKESQVIYYADKKEVALYNGLVK
jgi:hypothetical protein